MVLAWHHWILICSALGSLLGLYWLCLDQTDAPTDAEITHQTLFRMTFANWLMYCAATLGQCFCAEADAPCGLGILRVLAYILTFCSVLGVPLHSIEQAQQQTVSEK
jgi:hypothetical protein